MDIFLATIDDGRQAIVVIDKEEGIEIKLLLVYFIIIRFNKPFNGNPANPLDGLPLCWNG